MGCRLPSRRAAVPRPLPAGSRPATSRRPARVRRATLQALNASFRRTLEQENKSPRTIEAYTDAVKLLAAFCEANGLPVVARDLERDDIRAFIADQLAMWKPTTAHQRYRSLRTFFKWAVAEDAVRAEHLLQLHKTCDGRDFVSRRDTAIILLLVDTGMHRAECVGITLDDLDLDQRIVWVLGKGRRLRALPIGRKTSAALDRYLRVREDHRYAHLPHLWLGQRGGVTPSGIYQVIHDRAREAGLPDMHPHQLRHAFASSWLAEGGNENELMLVAPRAQGRTGIGAGCGGHRARLRRRRRVDRCGHPGASALVGPA